MGLDTVNFDRGATVVNIAIGAASANGTIPAGSENGTVQFACTIGCYFKWGFGSAPTATTSDIIIPGPWLLYLHVPAQATHWAVLQTSAGGFSSMALAHED